MNQLCETARKSNLASLKVLQVTRVEFGPARKRFGCDTCSDDAEQHRGRFFPRNVIVSHSTGELFNVTPGN